ncbi:radical SAM protein [Desulfopila aestuarii]|uniref:Radical SAM superfamily protein n=1 Tax=Desulfopila aestuarii DSM 18488 TaxID=1121416 RepID=A0A1M7Y1F8_9BACT|nr:radical SAM protein [Desulfopila aestuarii]SHO45609.1 Radical SAM superfamily protein [Desulfopila aestuarii DSM 18488]
MSYESPTIRPPSEWRSGLLRVTRGCNWNRCRFCGIYPHLGQPDYSIRPLEEIFDDIRLLAEKRPDIETLFLGDADPLSAGTKTMLRVLDEVKKQFDPTRITSYARFSTLYKLGIVELGTLAKAGLSRIHMGLESGDEKILIFQRKGQNAKMVRTVASWLKECDIELSVYVLLGLGGQERWQKHARETALLLNDIQPDYIRIRRLFVYPAAPDGSPPCPLSREISDGLFTEQSPEGTILELEMLLDLLEPMNAFFTCDHSNNYLNISGQLDTDKTEMLQEVRTFLSLPEKQRNQRYQRTGSGI